MGGKTPKFFGIEGEGKARQTSAQSVSYSRRGREETNARRKMRKWQL